MAQMTLVMGESGTGKTTSLRNCNPAITAIVNPVGKPLPFKGSFDTLNNVTDSKKIIAYMKKEVADGKKMIVVDDFQYILAVPYMNRIKESGWDKWNDFGANYFEIIEICKELPDDVTVYYMTHTETLENGLTTIKLIGKLLREKITIEGLFTIVLRTGVSEGNYFFFTQNSGKDTVKSPMGMFPTYAIENDLQYVDDKIRSYYQFGEFKSDAEMEEADKAVASDLEKPDARGRRSRSSKPTEPEAKVTERHTRKSRSEVIDDNINKIVNSNVTESGEPIKFEDAKQPELEPVPRRSRREKAEEDVSVKYEIQPTPEVKAPTRRSRRPRAEVSSDGFMNIPDGIDADALPFN